MNKLQKAMTGFSFLLAVSAATTSNSGKLFAEETTGQNDRVTVGENIFGSGVAALEFDLTKIIQIAEPAVVKTSTMSDEEMQKRAEEIEKGDKDKKPVMEGTGSGTFFTPDGLILTNAHVLKKNSDTITIHTDDQQELTGKVLGRNKEIDLAVVKVDLKSPLQECQDAVPQQTANGTGAGTLCYLELGDSGSMMPGKILLALGYPEGSKHVTFGILGSNRQMMPTGEKHRTGFLRDNISIIPGNSGGPLIALEWKKSGPRIKIEGVNTATMMGVVGYSIPIDVAKGFLPELTGKIPNNPHIASLGVLIQSMTKQMAEKQKLTVANGVLIKDVMKDSPAEKVGIKKGDVITGFNGKEVKISDDIVDAVQNYSRPGEEITLDVLRNGKELKFKVVLSAIVTVQDQVAKALDFAKHDKEEFARSLAQKQIVLDQELQEGEQYHAQFFVNLNKIGAEMASRGISPEELKAFYYDLGYSNGKKGTLNGEFKQKLSKTASGLLSKGGSSLDGSAAQIKRVLHPEVKTPEQNLAEIKRNPMAAMFYTEEQLKVFAEKATEEQKAQVEKAKEIQAMVPIIDSEMEKQNINPDQRLGFYIILGFQDATDEGFAGKPPAERVALLESRNKGVDTAFQLVQEEKRNALAEQIKKSQNENGRFYANLEALKAELAYNGVSLEEFKAFSYLTGASYGKNSISPGDLKEEFSKKVSGLFKDRSSLGDFAKQIKKDVERDPVAQEVIGKISAIDAELDKANVPVQERDAAYIYLGYLSTHSQQK